MNGQLRTLSVPEAEARAHAAARDVLEFAAGFDEAYTANYPDENAEHPINGAALRDASYASIFQNMLAMLAEEYVITPD